MSVIACPFGKDMGQYLFGDNADDDDFGDDDNKKKKLANIYRRRG